ncbi:MAG: hypothetical protein QOE31_1099 [Solirubrobacteraceae bacterium]|nr:hypothetical protein [Solirubrobacteraceae bacterium]
MERWVLNHFSTTEIVVLVVGGMVLLTLAAVLLARWLLPDLANSRFDQVADSLRTVYELIFALILAFVIAAVLDTMGQAEATVATEATQIAQLVRGNDTFAPRDTLHLNDAVDNYVHALADNEWQTMQHGEESPVATAALEALYAEYRNLKPRGAVQDETFNQGLSKLDDIAADRRDRLNIASADLPTLLRVLVAIGIILLLVLEYRPALARGASLAFMGSLAAIVTATYLLTLVLNYPFSGTISVSSDPLKHDRLATFWDEDLRYRKAAGDRDVRLEPDTLRGSWNSNAFGTLVMRCYPRGERPDASAPRESCRQDDDWFGAYRSNDGAVSGRLSSDGMFYGWWREEPAKIDDDASAVGAGGVKRKVANSGAFAWRAVQRSGTTLLVGCWAFGEDGRHDPDEKGRKVHPGWDLKRLGSQQDPLAEPRDLAERLDAVRSAPRVPRTRQPVRDCVRRAS